LVKVETIEVGIKEERVTMDVEHKFGVGVFYAVLKSGLEVRTITDAAGEKSCC
jgi:hypothetical protein